MLRGQFEGLKVLVDAAAAGGVTDAQVDVVNTTEPSNPAVAGVSLAGGVLHFSFTLPRGIDGMQGQPGIPGNNGSDGGPGPQGPPFAQAIIDSVTTLPPGSNATVSVMFDGSNVRFNFGIPAGFNGTNGIDGAPGEVTNAQLTSAIAGTSGNSNAVATLDTPFTNDPATSADLELMRAKYNELVLALRRP